MSKYQYYANCKDCFAEIEYKSSTAAIAAERAGRTCKTCKTKRTNERQQIGLTRNCPSCCKLITCSSRDHCKRSNETNQICHQCSSERSKSIHYSGLTRNCPSCNVELTYSSTDGATMANRLGTTCKSCSLKGQIPSPQCMAAALKVNTGIKRTEEHMAAIIAANTGIYRSEETRAKLSAALKGRVFSPETKLKMSKSARNKPPVSIATRLKRRILMTGSTHSVSQDARDRISAANSGRIHTPEARLKMKIAQNTRYGREPDWQAPYTVSELRTWGNHAKAKTPYCERCKSTTDLHAHHIKPKCLYPELALDISNARVLCEECHKNCHRKNWIAPFLIDRRFVKTGIYSY